MPPSCVFLFSGDILHRGLQAFVGLPVLGFREPSVQGRLQPYLHLGPCTAATIGG
jgi:hypothetical protein